jgi:multidrug resistance efflux pump
MRIKKPILYGLAGVAALGLGLAAGGFWGFRPRPAGPVAGSGLHAAEQAPQQAVRVKVIKPRVDKDFKVTVGQPCYVEPYYRINLEARVAGPVKQLTKAIGSPVHKDEVILTIDVPDQDAEVAKKEEMVTQRQSEVEVARAMALKARADVDVAQTAIREKKSRILAADAHTDFRRQEWQRFQGMAARGTIGENVAAERKKDYEEAAADSESARAALEKAEADLKAAREKVKEADADVKYKEAMVRVAQRDLKVAQELLKYATLRSPCDGVITRRNVDPGSFVQSSATGRGEVLLTIERSDIVTLYMNLPDNYAPLVTHGTEAEIEMSELPGVTIRGKVSRSSESLITESSDRTLRVEVDLWNQSPEKYRAFVKQEEASKRAGLKDGVLPLLPSFRGPKAAQTGGTHLLPGMYGTMRLVLQNFGQAHLIPSGAVFSQGGQSYVYLVDQDNIARQYPVEVQVDDGRLAKVLLVETVNHEEVKRDLTDEDTLVFTNQGELSDGQAVRPTLTDW